jgi:hypothetical protein
VHAGDAGVTHVFKGALNGLALRIEDSFLRSNDDFGLHVKTGGSPVKNRSAGCEGFDRVASFFQQQATARSKIGSTAQVDLE